jgi:hypothetical protein
LLTSRQTASRKRLGNARRWDATCAYNGNQDEARLVRLDPANNRR